MKAPRKAAVTLSSAGLVASLFAATGGQAYATEGPAPAPATRTVIAGVHTDAISTFWEGGQLVLASKADTPELHTRYEAGSVWFHISNGLRVAALPAGYEFVAGEGSTVWLAPQTYTAGETWPGFSTESVPLGTLDGDATALTLVDVDGPGDVELWQTGSFGSVTRLWSSDESAYKSFTRGNVHMHANWAFTAAGIYNLTVKAEAAVGGNPVSDTAVYTFVVGDLPTPAATTTTMHVHGSQPITLGDEVELHAMVDPDSAEGYVEFRDGSTVLGHEALEDGEAEFVTDSLSLGIHQITAHFVPKLTNLAQPSGSSAATVTIAEPTPAGLSILGLAGHYHSNRPITLTAVLTPEDATPATYRWYVQRADQAVPSVFGGTDGPVFTITAEPALNGAIVTVERLVSGSVTHTADPVTIEVDDHGAPAPQVVAVEGSTEYTAGQTATLTATVTPATVLDRYQWYVKPVGAAEASPVAGETGATYSFTADAVHDGAEISVAVTGEDGQVVYGPALPTTLAVAPAQGGGEDTGNDRSGDGAPGGSTASPTPTKSADSSLPLTGASGLTPTLATAGALLLAGLSLLVWSRRRRSDSTTG
ncbi:MAG: choice-of-anchor M domain-containing protein [Bifidobacteriaceae bacterium]|jgi:surface-anchored protein/LPXTG-motif cell wall-anchored protein|nr:choice-of-anchor M domain-containing protein [Bifidobacteriaceae bacterium]